jgi:hypothetical protein
MSIVKVDVVSLAVAAAFVGKYWTNCKSNGSRFGFEISTLRHKNDMRH